MAPLLALLLAISRLAAADNGVKVRVTVKYEKEPASISREFPNPCVYDSDGRSVKAASECAGVVKARPFGTMKPGWKTKESGSLVTSYLESVYVPMSLTQSLRISSDYEEGSCAYAATRAHELKHWNANIRLFRAKALVIKRVLGKVSVPTKEKPLAASAEAVQHYRELYEKLVFEAIGDKVKELSNDMRDSAAELDDPAVYKRDDYSQCSAAQWKGRER